MAPASAKNPIIVVVPRDVKVRTFFGDEGVRETKVFLEDIAHAWQTLHLETDTEKTSYLYSHVGEDVRVELKCLLDGEEPSPQRLISLIKSAYGEKRTVPALMRAFHNVHQRSGESIRAFSHRLHSAFESLTQRQRDTNVRESESVILRDVFVEGVRDRDSRRQLREKLLSSPQLSFTKVRECALKWEEEEDDDGDEECEVRQMVAEGADLMKVVRSLSEQVGRLTNQLSQQQQSPPSVLQQQPQQQRPQRQQHWPRDEQGWPRRREIICFSCKGSGHVARRCPQQSSRGSKSIRVTGTVKWFNVKDGYGFINCANLDRDVFIHKTAIIMNNPLKQQRSVGDGETVEFELVEGPKGHKAVRVTGPGGTHVQGSVHAAFRRTIKRGGSYSPDHVSTNSQTVRVNSNNAGAQQRATSETEMKSSLERLSKTPSAPLNNRNTGTVEVTQTTQGKCDSPVEASALPPSQSVSTETQPLSFEALIERERQRWVNPQWWW